MTIVELLAKESPKDRANILTLAMVAGVFSTLPLIIVNWVAAAPERANAQSFLVFALSAAIYLFTMRRMNVQLVTFVEGVLHRLKARVVEKIERADLERIERIGMSEIFDRVTENVSAISTAAAGVGGMLSSLCLMIVSTLYLISLMPAALFILVPIQFVAIPIYQSRQSIVERLQQTHAASRIHLLDRLMDLVKGVKEIKLNSARSRGILDDFARASGSLRDVAAQNQTTANDLNVLVNSNLYVLLAAFIFVLPKHIDVDGPTLTKLVSLLLFTWGSVQGAIGGWSVYVSANQSLEQIRMTEEKLDETIREAAVSGTSDERWRGASGRIEVLDIEYEYTAMGGDKPFHIGPIHLSIEPGEILFIVGGNGSGKSTLLKVLTGLYTPSRGTLRVGGVSVDPFKAAAYRELISAIFADFHLFSKAYGLLDVDPEAVQALLRQMQIERKTSFQNGAFTTRDLSTGQKKRIAMTLALLEDRPIFVLDEWAADQDPEFRKYFYENLLPALKRKGKTVIAVSHDDRYFHCADRVVVMEYGQIRTIRTNSSEEAVSPAKKPEAPVEGTRVSATAPELG